MLYIFQDFHETTPLNQKSVSFLFLMVWEAGRLGDKGDLGQRSLGTRETWTPIYLVQLLTNQNTVAGAVYTNVI